MLHINNELVLTKNVLILRLNNQTTHPYPYIIKIIILNSIIHNFPTLPSP